MEQTLTGNRYTFSTFNNKINSYCNCYAKSQYPPPTILICILKNSNDPCYSAIYYSNQSIKIHIVKKYIFFPKDNTDMLERGEIHSNINLTSQRLLLDLRNATLCINKVTCAAVQLKIRATKSI